MKKYLTCLLILALIVALPATSAMAEADVALSVDVEQRETAEREVAEIETIDLAPEGIESASAPLDAPAASNPDEPEYEIEDGVLTKWNGQPTAVTVPNGVTAIGFGAFWYKTEMKSVKLPGSVTRIEDEAFYQCNSLTEINLPNSITSIGEDAFYRCLSLETLKLPTSLKTIPHGLCKECTHLAGIVIPDGVTAIEDSAFYQCYNLTSITIPASVKKIGESVFESTPKALVIKTPSGSYAAKYAKAQGITVEIVYPKPDSVAIKQGESATLYMGNTLKLKAVLKPSNASTKLTWSSSNKKVATVKDGVVTPVKAGKATITVKTTNKKTAKIVVEVIDADSVTLKEGTKAKLKAGKKLTLHATVSPSEVKTALTWKSSNKKVATVSSKGVVKAKKKGTAIITVTTKNGKKAQIKITVRK